MTKLYNQLKELLLDKDNRLISQRVKPMIFEKYENGELLKKLIKETDFLSDDVKISERVYCVLNKFTEKPKCKVCWWKVRFVKYSDWYNSFCSPKCVNASPEVIEKRIINNMAKYGVKSPAMLDSEKERTRKILYDKYWENYEQIQLKKREETNIKKYGVKNPSNVDEFKQKREETTLKRTWYKNNLLDPKVRETIKNTIKEKYWVDNISQNEDIKKLKEKKSLEIYKVPNVFLSKEVQEKIKQTNLKKYGYVNPSSVQVVKNKKIKKCQETYGEIYTNNLQVPEIREKIKQTNLVIYGYEHPTKSDVVKNKMKNTWLKISSIWTMSTHNAIKSYNIEWQKHNIEFSFIDWNYYYKCNTCWSESIVENRRFISNRLYWLKTSPCLTCVPFQPNVSFVETNFSNFIKKIYKGETINNTHSVIKPLEIDIYLPELKIGIEIHWLYWHSDKYKWKNDHYDKMKLCEQQGVQLYQFFEDEIPQAMMLMYSIIANRNALKENLNLEELNIEYNLSLTELKKVFARNMTVKLLDKKDKRFKELNDIMETYHVQWWDNAKYKYVLFDKENNIVSIMTFKKMSVDKNQKSSNSNNTYELSRYVTLPGYQVIGWFQKLLNAFKKDMPKTTILTYSNLRYSSEFSNVYLRNWFQKIWFTWINYYYFFEWRKMHRFNFRKDNLYNTILPKYGLGVDPDYKKESEKWMVERLSTVKPVTKVYDAGHIKWVLE